MFPRSRIVPIYALVTSTLFAATAPAPRLVLEEHDRVPHADIADASEDAQQALARVVVPAGLEVSLWAAEPMLANPVAAAFDEHGRLFVSETYRYRTSVLDIRNYMGMLEQDMALRTVDDRLQMIRDVFGEQSSQLAIESERVRLVEDRDGDGVADYSTVFAEGFNTELDGIASGVLARKGEVWFTNIPSLWRLTGDPAEGDRPSKATKREELLRGFGVRFGYTGHDFHGLAFGPDGKLYFSIGDRGTHVTTPEGYVVARPDEGAVYRSNPDGTELELFAYGLRNPQELVFDEHGNLWTGDNDCDNGDLERLVYLVEGSDSGWRVGHQHAPLRNAGMWNREHLWLPRFPGQPAYILPPVCNIEDGPSGLTYYPGTGLTPEYRGHFFITHFKGSIASSGVQSYQVRPEGATFVPTASSQFVGGLLPTDVMFGPDGRFYVIDWVEGWPKSRKGRVYAVQAANEDPGAKERRLAMKRLFSEGMEKRGETELIDLLAHPDQRIRQEAQFELADRGPKSIPALQALAEDAGAAQLARLHAIWGLGQLARVSKEALQSLPGLLSDADAEVRAQAVKLLGDHKAGDAYEAVLARLVDEAPRVRFFAAQSLGKLGRPEATPALLAYLRRNDDRDTYERHAAVHALERIGATPALAAAVKDSSRAVRLGALLVYRRLGDATAAEFLNDSDPFIVQEAVRAINDAPIPAAFPALAAHLQRTPLKDENQALRVLNAHFRLGKPENARALAAFAARADAPDVLRGEALVHLAAWGAPPARDRIVGLYRPLPDREAGPAVAALTAQLPALLGEGPVLVRERTLAAIESLKIDGAIPELHRLVADEKSPSTIRARALSVLEALNDPKLIDAAKVASNSTTSTVRLAALPILARLSPEQTLPLVSRLAREGNGIEQRQAYATAGKLDLPETTNILVEGLERLAAGKVDVAAQFELLEAAEKSGSPKVKALLEHQQAAWAQGSDPLAPFRGALSGGNPRAGADVFYDHPVMACVRCHKVWGSGGEAGPDLSMIGRQQSPEYILESVIKPNARIAPGFDVIAVTLRDGTVEAGTVVSETADTLHLRRADLTETTVPVNQIVKREAAPSSMPEIYQAVLSRTELRDLMAFLLNLNSNREPPINDGPRALRTGLPEEHSRGDEATLEAEEDPPAEEGAHG